MTDYVTVTGSFKWTSRLFNADEFNGKRTWSVQFYPDDVDYFYGLQRQGMKNTIKKDDDGFNLKVSRPVEKETKKGLLRFEPPKVTGPAGEALTSSFSNGAKGELTISVYEHNVPGSTRKAKAIRLERVKITEFADDQKQQETSVEQDW